MTQEEKQEIINAVLSAIMTNSKTIEQLTPTESLSDNDAIEVSGGRRISYAAFLSAVQVGVQLMLDGYLTGEAAVALFAALENNPANYVDAPNNPVQLHWRQSPIVLLDSMGEDLDGDDDFTAQVGDKWWDPTNSTTKNYIFLKTSTGQDGWPIGTGNVNDVLYVNKRTGRMYLWDGTDMVELVGATGGGSNVYIDKSGPNYVDIIIDDNTPVIEVSTSSIVMSGDNKTATFTVSGHNLTAPIKINGGNAYFSKSPSSISPVGGIVEATTVTVTFGGTNDDTDDLIVSSVGATAQTIHVAYTAVAGPNIIVSPATLSFKAATNQIQTKQVAVQGSLLTDDVEVTAGGAFQVSLQSASGFADSVTIPKASALAGITVYVRYTAGSSATTGTLTLTSDGAADKTVDLTGAVNGTLSILPASAPIGIVSGGSGTAQFTVTGANLTPASTASVAVSGTGMSADKQTLTVGQDGTINEVVTVTFSGSADSNGTLTVSHADADDDAEASITGSIVTPLAVGTVFRKGDLLYTVLSGQTTVSVKQVKVASGVNIPSGAVVIPATISDENATESDGTTPITGASGMTYNVTEVAAQAFNSNSGVTSLIIPEGVTKIGANAFYGNSANKLANINIPSTCTTFVATSGGVNDGPRNMIVFAAGSTINMALNSIWSNSLDSVVVLTAYTSGMSLTDFPKFNISSSSVGSFLQKSSGGNFGSSNVNTTLYVPDQATKTFLEGSGDAAYNNFAGGIKLISELSQSDKDYINSL